MTLSLAADDANIQTVLDSLNAHQHERAMRNHVRSMIRFNRARIMLIARYLTERGALAGNQVDHCVWG